MRIETTISVAASVTPSRHPDREIGVRIETGSLIPFSVALDVTPIVRSGCGLKPYLASKEAACSGVTPIVRSGCGLKRHPS